MPLKFAFNTIFFLLTLNFSAQQIEYFHLKKDQPNFIFFQKGTKNDTIVPNKSDQFYLLLSDSIKQSCFIEVENAQLIATKNDSIILLKYFPTINYLHKFVSEENELEQLNRAVIKTRTKLKMITLVNGASNITQSKIKISFMSISTKIPFAEFVYYVPKN